MSSTRPTLRLSLLSAAVIGLSAMHSTPAFAQSSTARSVQSYDIPPGPLADALEAFARAAGINLAFEASALEGQNAVGLRGEYGIADGLNQLLAGSAWQAIAQGNGYVLQRLPVAQVGTTMMSAVRVEADTDRDAVSEGTRSYTARAVTLGKTQQTLREIPQSVSVITRQRMDDQNLTTLTEALEQSTGITVTSSGTLRNAFMARGFDLNVFQLDGMPYTPSADVGDNPDLATYDRVEVLRGAAGLLQGVGNPSGTVNLVRKRPTAEFAASLTAHMGSWNDYRGDIDVSGPLNASGSLRGRAVVSYQDNDYFYDVATREKRLAYAIGEYDLTPTTLLTAGATLIRTDATPDLAGMPMYSDGGDLHLPRSTFLGATWNRYQQESDDVFVELRQALGKEWTARLIGSYVDQHNDWANLFVLGPIDRESGSGGRAIASAFPDYLNRNHGADLFVTGPFQLFGRRHELLFGGNLRSTRGRFSFHRYDGTLGSADVFDWNPNAAPPEAFLSAPFFRFYTEEKQSGAYATVRLSVNERLKLIGGGRYSWWEGGSHYGSEGQFVGASSSAKKSRVPTWYGGATYDLGQRYTLYASYADVFQPQTNLAFPGKVIDPIVGANYESGIKGAFFDDRLNASLAVFRIEQQNRALTDPAHPCVTNDDCYYIASGKVRSQGIEAEVQGEVTPSWNLFAGYTYVDTEYLKDRNADDEPTTNEGAAFSTVTPHHLFKLWTQYRLPSNARKWTVGGGAQAQSAYFAQSGAVRIRQGGYWLANARLAYDFNDRISAGLNANNLFDRRYYASLDTTSSANFYGEPRNFMLTVRARY